MKILGIDFIPWNEPLHRRLETLAVAGWFLVVTLGGYTCLFFSIFLLFTQFCWVILLYFLWIYLDHNTCETGGRPILWVQKWAWWRYLKNYFPVHLKMASNCKLDPKKNYLFCCFPHGVVPVGPFCSTTVLSSNFHRLYPEFQVKTTSLSQLYYLPFTRELGLALGGISCSKQSLNFLLTKPEGGYIANLFPGGAAESLYAQPGRYKFVVKNRKGFVKVALRSGAPLVPVITFGECDLFDQIQGPNISRFQEFVKKYLGFAPILCVGRGFFQNSFGLIPRRKPLTTVVGAPIEVKKNQKPTREEINRLHQVFVEELVALFETYKHEFLENHQNIHLELE